MALMTLEQAKADLSILNNARDAEIADKIEQASAIILDYLKQPDAEWTPEDAPFVVRAATSLCLRSLFFDDNSNPITEGVKALLRRMRDPAIA